MKKILTAILIATFFLGAGAVNAQKEEKNERPKAEILKIKKKQPITDEERKKMDDAENNMTAKGLIGYDTIDGTEEFISATGDEVPVTGSKYAIVIGMANYPGTVNDLCVPEAVTPLNYPTKGLTYYCKDDDSYHMKNTLLSSDYGFKSENVKWLADANATYGNIKDAVDEIVPKLGKDDELVFFFSGHGFGGESNFENSEDLDAFGEDEFIAIYDENYNYTGPKYLKKYDYFTSNSLISDDEIKGWFEGVPARMTFIFDTCGAGGMDDLEGNNRILAMSSPEGQTSYTYYLGGTQTDTKVYQESQGLFSHYFVNRAIEDGKGDGFNDAHLISEKVSIEEAFGYAYGVIAIEPTLLTPPERVFQTPISTDSDILHDFLP